MRTEVYYVNIAGKDAPNAFDFASEAESFRKKLWIQLHAKALTMSPAIVDDEDLACVNAAGEAGEFPLEKDDFSGT